MVQASGKRRTARIAVDFDGTIATRSWPDIDKDTRVNRVLVDWLKKRRNEYGDELMLWTCRENYGGLRFPDREYLNDAVQFCTRNCLFFQGTNRNPGEAYGEYLSGSKNWGRKLCADAYIDDRSLPFDPDGRLAGLWWRLYLFLMDRKLAKMGRNRK